MELIQCTVGNGLFPSLKSQWLAQVETEDIGPVEYFLPMLEHAERIAAETPTDPRYGIFAVKTDDGEFHGLAHINHAVPIRAVRVVWQILAPIHHGDQIETFKVAPIIATLFRGAWELYTGRWSEAEELKIYCPSQQDRFLFQTAASFLREAGMDLTLERGGSWIHIKSPKV